MTNRYYRYGTTGTYLDILTGILHFSKQIELEITPIHANKGARWIVYKCIQEEIDSVLTTKPDFFTLDLKSRQWRDTLEDTDTTYISPYQISDEDWPEIYAHYMLTQL